MQLINKEAAKTALENCDLSNKANFKPYVQRDLENIFAKRGQRIEIKPIDEAINIDSEEIHEVVKKENK
jgi:hypothetical protein